MLKNSHWMNEKIPFSLFILWPNEVEPLFQVVWLDSNAFDLRNLWESPAIRCLEIDSMTSVMWMCPWTELSEYSRLAGEFLKRIFIIIVIYHLTIII